MSHQGTIERFCHKDLVSKYMYNASEYMTLVKVFGHTNEC